MSSTPLDILFIASEVAPVAKTGGLADVLGALPDRLARRGHRVRVVLPHYSAIDSERFPSEPVAGLDDLPIQLGAQEVRVAVRTMTQPGSRAGVDLYLLDCPEHYDRPEVYTGTVDEAPRFALLARAALTCCQHLHWTPDIVHANDWHASLVPLYLRTDFAWDRDRFGAARSVLTIHNLAYQGIFGFEMVEELGLAHVTDRFDADDRARGVVNFLKTGLLHADAITTVSPNYAREIQTPEVGAGLDDVLRTRAADLVGILDGIDHEVWNPRTDPKIPHHYGIEDGLEGVAAGKRANRDALLERLNLAPDPVGPVLGIVARMTEQKGFEITFGPLARALAAHDLRLVVLGRGEPKLEDGFRALERAFPGRVRLSTAFDDELAHHIEAGADLFLMPSRFEPCGLNQLYSLRYGTVPLVRATGGLADTITHFDPATGEGNGFVFEDFDETGFAWALGRALEVFDNPEAWARLRTNGMRRDVSWTRQAREFEALYRRLVDPLPRAVDDKPNAAVVGWRPTSTRTLFRSAWYLLRQDEIATDRSPEPTVDEGLVYTYIEHPGSVFVVPVTPDGHIVLLRAYRYTVDDWTWEIPAGALGDQEDAVPETVARRELREEIGGVADTLQPLGHYFMANGFADHPAHLFLALDVETSAAPEPEAGEAIDARRLCTLDEVERMLDDGSIRDGDSAFALLKALAVLRRTHPNAKDDRT
ncbi:MAG: glycogen synthase GlgA [Acidobacteriota bacterium]